jgi:hypothetical protein
MLYFFIFLLQLHLIKLMDMKYTLVGDLKVGGDMEVASKLSVYGVEGTHRYELLGTDVLNYNDYEVFSVFS